ncbi:Gfa-like protein [Rubellimicrobium mesophilum DSM 19309]|uniref:Gfa-like protein n=1 Tax=Rubellimicrobium mesophilum DSM 19309 TaxID=442562 RepID=A0A017HJE7_9RHOB|nr:GFA family protein [Rubellimicrobium mesophilum]EYD74597.1 Gfa-like protein [Rubellimicrobium mesophilum DSM 19309]
MSDTRTGGCQCGAVRYAFEGAPENVHLCHCRMCQKAVGGPFAAICPVPKSAFRVTRGEIAWFASSDVARRGFCRDCGTPLIFDYPHDPGIGVLAGTLDRPDLAPPVIQYGTETRVPWFDRLPDLPGQPIDENDPDGVIQRVRASNHQHPDHDTTAWPPR